MLKARLISKFEIQYDGKPVVLRSGTTQSLFAYLILTAGTLAPDGWVDPWLEDEELLPSQDLN